MSVCDLSDVFSYRYLSSPETTLVKFLLGFYFSFLDYCCNIDIVTISNFVIEYLSKIETEFKNTLACLSGAQMGSNHEKNWRSKIWWHTPFKRYIFFASISLSLIFEGWTLFSHLYLMFLRYILESLVFKLHLSLGIRHFCPVGIRSTLTCFPGVPARPVSQYSNCTKNVLKTQ